MTFPEFKPFPKIPRFSREYIVTEKIDGTNAQIYIEEINQCTPDGWVARNDTHAMWAGSRNRWLLPGASMDGSTAPKTCDNFGFAAWVLENSDELFKLGPGNHYGEWWGSGIQRGYGLKEKRFSLFNTKRWGAEDSGRPECCHVVPVLDWWDDFGSFDAVKAISYLCHFGSSAAPGYMNPEGIVIFHPASGQFFKKTIVGDEKPKTAA